MRLGTYQVVLLIFVSLLFLDTQAVRVTRAFGSLSFDNAVDIQTAPGDSTNVYVVEKKGIIQVFNRQTAATKSVFLDISTKVLNREEAGLLGLAFHPNFATNNFFFVYYYNKNSETVVARFTATSATSADATETILFKITRPFENHNGGQLQFGPDGLLYIASGDGGSADDPFNNGQNTDTRLGKILRIDVNRNTSPFYNIPAGNPFRNGNAPEIFHYGLRNPWRFSFDGNNIWIGDVGQNLWEEVSFAGITTGVNFGWKQMEGCNCFVTNCVTTGTIQPVAQYSHSVGSSITGGYVYRGTGVPELAGKYVFADFINGKIFTIDAGSATTTTNCGLTPVVLVDTTYSISTFGVISGELYFSDLGTTGGLYTFSPDNGVSASQSSSPVPANPSRSPVGVPSFPTSFTNSLTVAAVGATIQYKVDGSYIHIQVSAVSSGWLGIGISTDGSMNSAGAGSDIVVGYSSSGTSRVNDYFTTIRSQPQLDETQNLYNNFASYSGSTLIIRFTRLLNTGDTLSDRVIPVGTQFFFIVARGDTVPSDIDSFSYHAARGSVAVTLDPNTPPTTATGTSTGTRTATRSPIPTSTGTSTGTSTRSATPTRSPVPSTTSTVTATPTSSRDPLISTTSTNTHTPTASTTSTGSRTATATGTATATRTSARSTVVDPSRSSAASSNPSRSRAPSSDPSRSRAPDASRSSTPFRTPSSSPDPDPYSGSNLTDASRASFVSANLAVPILLLFILFIIAQ